MPVSTKHVFGRRSTFLRPVSARAHSGTGCCRSFAASSARQRGYLQGSTSLLAEPCLHLHCRAPQRKGRGSLTVTAAIFGVGAPEALLVGVVALVVFGPKGLAQAVKSLGATLRTFSPTIRELASVTNELSSTLQEQIGLDEIRNEFRNPTPSYRGALREDDTDSASTTDLDSGGGPETAGSPGVDEDLAAKIAESKQIAWGGDPPGGASAKHVSAEEASSLAEAASAKAGKAATDLSIEELEAEIRRRKEAASA